MRLNLCLVFRMDSKVRNIRYKASDIQHPQLTHKASMLNPYNPKEEIILDSSPSTNIINPLTITSISSKGNRNSNSSKGNTSAITKLKRLFGL